MIKNRQERFDIQNIKCVIFDMDGVIFNSEFVWKKAFEEANIKFGFNLTEKDRQHTCGMDEAHIRQELYARFPMADVDAYRDFMKLLVQKRTEEGIPLKKGFRKLISTIYGAGRKTALATSSDMSRAYTLFAKNNLSARLIFDAEVYANEVDKGKPNPQIFIKAASRAGVSPEKCIVIEDSPQGIEAAARGGFCPIMVVDLIAPTNREQELCWYIASNLFEVEKMLKEKWY